MNSLDECCKKHDAGWYEHNNGMEVDLDKIDEQFELCANEEGITGKMMSKIVGVQRKLRGITTKPAGDKMTKNDKNGNLRGAAKAATPKKNPAKASGTPIGSAQLSAPSAISSVLTSQPTRTQSTPRGIMVTGKEFVGSVEGQGVTVFGIGKSALLAPAYFYGGVLGNLAKCYSKYRFKKILIHYIPKVSTATSGQVVMCTSSNITMPFLQPESNSFLQRALVSGSGVMGPIWSPIKMSVATDSKLRFIDAFTNSDIDENVLCELQVYTQVGVSQQVGYLWMEYECELIDNVLEPHQNDLPVFSGPGTRVTLAASSAAPLVNSSVELIELTTVGLTSKPNGTVFRFVLDIQGSVTPGGTTFANAFRSATTRGQTTTVNQVVTTGDAIVGGMTLYLVVFGSALIVYNSVEQAISGNGSGQLYWGVTGNTTGAFTGDATVVRIGNSIMDDTQ